MLSSDRSDRRRRRDDPDQSDPDQSDPDQSDPDQSDPGQAVVELALSLPVVCLFLLGIVQVGLVVRDQLVVQHLAREAARAASVAVDPGAAARRVTSVPGLVRVDIRTQSGGGVVQVTVTGVSRTDVPMVGLLLGDVTVQASVTMAREPP